MHKFFIILSLLFCIINVSKAEDDLRTLVELPEMMQTHMMANMRDHLMAINEILLSLSSGQLDKAADIAEARLGMTSLNSHGANHMATFMPEGMRKAGTSMHKAASQFALIAQEGDVMQAYKKLPKITAACVSCHAGYRIR